MAQTAINKPIYDAFVNAGASEEKATLAARAVLPSVDEAATKTDITLLSSAIERLEEVMTAAITQLKADTTAAIGRSEEKTTAAIERSEEKTTAAIERSEEKTKAAIERSEANAKANNAELKVDLLRWMAVMLGVVVAALGLIINLSLSGLSSGGV